MSFNKTTLWLSILWIFFSGHVSSVMHVNNCFFLLLSWLPTYFHDTFPDAKVKLKNIMWFCLKNEPLWLVDHKLDVRRFLLDNDCYSIRKFVMQYMHIFVNSCCGLKNNPLNSYQFCVFMTDILVSIPIWQTTDFKPSKFLCI